MGSGPRGDPALVERLLREQHPDLADRPVSFVARGWDNDIFRLGRDLSVRLPRRVEAVALIEHERRWLPALTRRISLPIPVPVRDGRPGTGYPWPWGIRRWLAGVPACDRPPTVATLAACQLAEFFTELHRPAPEDAPANALRGVALAAREPIVAEQLAALGDLVDADRLQAVWDRARTAPPWEGPPVWLHGDLHPGNVLVQGGRIAAIIDFGDLTSGDPATDLAVAWAMFDADGRSELRSAYPRAADAATWTRARGWALAFGLAHLSGADADERNRRIGHTLLREVMTDPVHGI